MFIIHDAIDDIDVHRSIGSSSGVCVSIHIPIKVQHILKISLTTRTYVYNNWALVFKSCIAHYSSHILHAKPTFLAILRRYEHVGKDMCINYGLCREQPQYERLWLALNLTLPMLTYLNWPQFCTRTHRALIAIECQCLIFYLWLIHLFFHVPFIICVYVH